MSCRMYEQLKTSKTRGAKTINTQQKQINLAIPEG